MKHYLPPIITILVVIGVIWYGRQPVPNPDPNHTHADFALWVDINADTIQQVDFSSDEYMSGLSTDDSTHDEEGEYHHKYLHLHDKNGYVIHSHKPGQTIGEFFRSIGGEMVKGPTELPDGRIYPEDTIEWRVGEYTVGRSNGNITLSMFVNGIEVPFNPDYVFKDNDKILIISSNSKQQIEEALSKMTDDACLYSKTCPWRGAPPVENCIADPLVPCIAP